MVGRRAGPAVLLAATLIVSGVDVAGAMPRPWLAPYEIGQTYYVCQSYRGTASHFSGYSFDLSTYVAAPNQGGCDGVHGNDAAGNAATSPGKGYVSHFPGSDQVCINFDRGGSAEIGHLNLSVALNQVVSAGQQIGTVAPPSGLNGWFAHIHVEAHAAWGCGADVPFDSANRARMECAPNLPFGPNYTGTALPRCGAGTSLGYDVGDGTMRLYRWRTSGQALTSDGYTPSGGIFRLSRVGDRMAAGDFDGDAKSDVVMTYQNTNGTASFHVWSDATTYVGSWTTTGTFDLSRVGGRLAAGDWDGNGRDDVALVYDMGDGTMRIYRWLSTGSAFTFAGYVSSGGTFRLSNVDDRVAAGYVDNDGTAELVMAYQKSTGDFDFHVWHSAATYAGVWADSGTFDLDNVGAEWSWGIGMPMASMNLRSVTTLITSPS